MRETVIARQCDDCYFSRSLAGTLCCVKAPPTADPGSGRARWPSVQTTDICGAFRYARDNPIDHDHWPRNDLPIHTDRFGDYCKIPLTKGRFAKVDPDDYIWLSQFRWHCKVNAHTLYAVRTIQVAGRSQRIYMHRLIAGTPEGLVCDHINHDGLDNRKANVRNCTTGQNNANRRSARDASSQYLGVSRNRNTNKWVAHIKKNGKPKYLGTFDIEEDAARARDAAARKLHGPFAALNFPNEPPERPPPRATKP